ncbi:MAG: hypothetical protein JWM11_5699 [Planctomycetaceae bacterium]|nr:hypothetical protein [Planctomycetaceae bacterium]
MRIILVRCVPFVCCTLILLSALVLPAQGKKPLKAGASEPKNYTVDKTRGPWMIMVTSLRGDTPESEENANNAARELVRELRQLKIPAWIHQQFDEIEEIAAYDRTGHTVKRKVAAQQHRVCVLAGQYPSIEDKTGQETLAWMQKFHPKALEKGVYQSTPGRPGPLSRAFLTLNPLLSEEEIQAMAYQNDPLLQQLNRDRQFNLLENRGKYTVQVATFQGASKHVIANGQKAEKVATFRFDSMLEKNITLDKAGEDAWTLVHYMRAQGHEAYVYHERYRSIVTVGAFNDPNDPGIGKVAQAYGAKMKPDPQTRREVVTPVIYQFAGGKKAGQHMFLLDLQPQVIKVPKLK